ncbi:Bifunctional protein GlmU [bacterium HR39]|nr:Bifunctional protein GlmU [bacterium HR39]
MRSDLPKVLHPLAGFPLIHHVLRTAAALGPERTVVVLGHGAERVRPVVERSAPDAAVVVQEPQLGTGHAVQVGLDAVPERGTPLVLYGDTPLLRVSTLARLLEVHRSEGAALTLLAIRPVDPGAYGRIVLDDAGRPSAIVEARHVPPELLASNLCNSGVLAAEIDVLRRLLPRIRPHPQKGEYYLTDLVALARAEGLGVAMVEADAEEGLGANSQAELADLEARVQARLRHAAMERGVILPAPGTVHFALDTEVAPGARIEPYVVFGPGVRVGEGAVVRSFSHLEGAEVAAGAEVGPFARLRPGARIG